MPAFHLYSEYGRHYWNTFFPSENPIQKIQDEIVHWRKEEEKKLQANENLLAFMSQAPGFDQKFFKAKQDG
jgi:hypothetical protein